MNGREPTHGHYSVARNLLFINPHENVLYIVHA